MFLLIWVVLKFFCWVLPKNTLVIFEAVQEHTVVRSHFAVLLLQFCVIPTLIFKPEKGLQVLTLGCRKHLHEIIQHP